MTIESLIAQINVIVRTEFNKNYQEFEPKFKRLIHKFPSGPVESTTFAYAEFLAGIEKFTGSRKHNLFPDGHKFTIRNEEWDHAVDIKRKDIERAAMINSPESLNIYTKRIGEMPKMWGDWSSEYAFDMLIAGTASTYGTCFDGQTFFDTDHNYGPVAGSQSNIITSGAGVTAANIITDLSNILTRMNSFYYNQGGTTNGKKRKLNKSIKLLLVVPDQLFGIMEQVRTQKTLASGEENTKAGTFELMSLPMDDANDYYAVNVADDDEIFSPFLHQSEKEVELDSPTPQDESARERKVFTWGGYARGNMAYGAWWKAVKVVNS